MPKNDFESTNFAKFLDQKILDGIYPRFHPKSYVIPNDQKFMVMDAKDAFDGLTDKEQFYAHYLSR